MTLIRTLAAAGAFLCLTLANPVAAQASQERTLEVPASASWTHRATGMTLPAQVSGMNRLHIRDSGSNEFDVIGTYANRDEGMFALVYIYRTMTPSVPIWFDRVLTTVMLPQTGAQAPNVSAFARPGASVASGLRTATTDIVAGTRSTAIAIVPLGRSWLVEVRLGSNHLDPAALDARMSTFIAALPWPAETGAPQAAVPIVVCASPLRLQTARTVEQALEDVLIQSAIASAEPGKDEGPPPVYCREPGATLERGVYRPGGATNSYLIAIRDAGIALEVGETTSLAALLGRARGSHHVSMTLLERNSSSVYSSFDRLPPPDQAFEVLSVSTSPLSTTVDGNGDH